MRRVWIFEFPLVGLLIVSGCEGRAIKIDRPPSREIYADGGANYGRVIRVSADGAAKITPEAKAEADSIFDDRCTACHGATGDGKGPAAMSMKPGPKDFRDAKWQTSVNDEKITKAIVSGGEAVGLSAAMPGNPDLEDRPAVVAALVAHIRGFGK
jgi:mono/diheme cytochrome c family protein